MKDQPYIIRYPDDMDTWAWEDAPSKGGAAAKVILSDGHIFDVTFLSIERFVSATEASYEHGIPCYYVENLIVLKEVTKTNVELTIDYLYNLGYFTRRLGITDITVPPHLIA
jgi:hypothetical protein